MNGARTGREFKLTSQTNEKLPVSLQLLVADAGTPTKPTARPRHTA